MGSEITLCPNYCVTGAITQNWLKPIKRGVSKYVLSWMKFIKKIVIIFTKYSKYCSYIDRHFVTNGIITQYLITSHY